MIRQVYSDRVQWKIGVFLLLTFVISSFFYYIIISSSTVFDIGGFWMWSPGIAAILTKMLFRENLRDFGLKIEKPKYLVLGLSIPFLYALLIHSLVWVTGVGEFTPQPALKIFLFSTLGLVIACFFALGEEIGWRGLLIPELTKITSFTISVLITGIVWAAWHYPAIIFADYNSQTPLLFQLGVITITGQDEIGNLARSFNKMSRQLLLTRKKMEAANKKLIQAEKLASIGRISAGIAHEIRNPLTSVKLNIQKLTQSHNLDEMEREHLNLSQEGIRHMEKSIKDLLDFTRASEILNSVLEILPGDGPARLYLNRCHNRLSSPPPENWDGVHDVGLK